HMKVGDRVLAKIVERVNGNIFIVNLNGRLLRVKNTTDQDFQAQQQVELKVTAVNPLAFQLAEIQSKFSVSV
ncbi:MAG: hypothetical protein KDD40_11245, partial [Bdellovibrionales bacterium]|nr:hypothetical protein [Bdellovibrionales bacterium]